MTNQVGESGGNTTKFTRTKNFVQLKTSKYLYIYILYGIKQLGLILLLQQPKQVTAEELEWKKKVRV